MVLKQREVILVDFPYNQENSFIYKGQHYAVVLHYSDDNMQTVLVCPLTSKKDGLNYNKRGLLEVGQLISKKSPIAVATINQIRAIDKDLIIARNVDMVSIEIYDKILKELWEVIGN